MSSLINKNRMDSRAFTAVNFFSGISNLEERLSKIDEHIMDVENKEYLPIEYRKAYIAEFRKHARKYIR